MNEVLHKLILIILIFSLFSSVDAFMPIKLAGNDKEKSQIQISTKLKDISQSDIERVRKEAEIALNSIPPILGIKFNKKIKIRIVKQKGRYHIDWTNKSILLPIWYLKNKIAPIVQLISSVIVVPTTRAVVCDPVYRTGLGVFFQEKFGEDKSFYNYDIPDLTLHDLVIMHRNNLMPLFWLKYKKRGYWEPEIIKLAFIESGSFVSFLYEKYGDQKFKELYKTGCPVDYKKVYGKSIQELEKEWLYYVFVELSEKEPKTANSQLKEITKKYIMVQQSESIYEDEKVKFKVNSGDVLEVVKSITCRSGSDECWIVHNIETGMRGIINAERAKSLHQVKTEKVSP